jgi:formamidopyrimidine-DNA glycosylase
MPELPEVETIARTLAPQIRGRKITSAAILHPRVLQAGTSLLSRLNNAEIEKVSRRGKLLLLTARQAGVAAHSDGPLYLAFHLKMTGRFFVHPENSAPQKHTRLIFDLDDGRRLFFDDIRTFGYCRIMLASELPQWPFWVSLGPEPLDMPPKKLAAHLGSVFADRRAAVKSLLLDQRILAGIGNIYADESLFRAGILPAKSAADVAPDQLLRLATSLQDILLLSIRQCGSSIRDYRDALGNAGAFQNSFAVYGRKDGMCLSCGGSLSSTRIGGRSTVFCGNCQK